LLAQDFCTLKYRNGTKKQSKGQKFEGHEVHSLEKRETLEKRDRSLLKGIKDQPGQKDRLEEERFGQTWQNDFGLESCQSRGGC